MPFLAGGAITNNRKTKKKTENPNAGIAGIAGASPANNSVL
jgi:hypothetical protein